MDRKKVFNLYEKGYPIYSIISIIFNDCNTNKFLIDKPTKKEVTSFVFKCIKSYCLYEVNKSGSVVKGVIL